MKNEPHIDLHADIVELSHVYSAFSFEGEGVYMYAACSLCHEKQYGTRRKLKYKEGKGNISGVQSKYNKHSKIYAARAYK